MKMVRLIVLHASGHLIHLGCKGAAQGGILWPGQLRVSISWPYSHGEECLSWMGWPMCRLSVCTAPHDGFMLSHKPQFDVETRMSHTGPKLSAD